MMGLGCQLSNLRRKSLKNGGQNGLSEKDIKNIVPQQSLQKVISNQRNITCHLNSATNERSAKSET